jgi:RHS repeat-associated protein
MNVTSDTVAGLTQNYVYEGNRLSQVKDAGGTVLHSYLYDLDGNLNCVTYGVGSAADCGASIGGPSHPNLYERYSWDFLDRLQAYHRYDQGQSSVEDVDYHYDPLDRLIREVDTKPGVSTRRSCFSYLGLSDAASKETRVLGACTDNPTLTKSYAYDAGLERTSVTVSGSGPDDGDFYFGRNVHGDVSLLVRDNGTTKASYGYLPYGQSDSGLSKGDFDPSDPLNPYRFNDRRLDPATGSEEMGARRYGAGLGRFLQQDSYPGAEDDLGLSLDPLSANRYAFAAGNPLNFGETDGHRFAFQQDTHAPGSGRAGSGDGGSSGPSSTTRSYWRNLTKMQNVSPCGHANRDVTTYQCGISSYVGGGDTFGDWASAAGHAAVELSGYHDFQRCRSGDSQSCAWAVIGYLPGGRIAREAKAARDLEEAGRAARAAHDADRAAKGVDELAARVPEYTGGKTQGALRIDGGDPIDLISGRAGPAASIPKGTPGFDAYVRTHVEGHAAALLRQQGGGRATLFINQVPCPNCARNLERALPEGAELEIFGPNGFRRTYVGVAD